MNLSIDKIPPKDIEFGRRFLASYLKRNVLIIGILSHVGLTGAEVVVGCDFVHHGRKNQKWGERHGPPYPLDKETVNKFYDKGSENNNPRHKGNPSNNKEKSDGQDKPKWSKDEQKKPFDYWALQNDKTGYPRHLKARGFSHPDTLKDHFVRHGTKMGYQTEADYQTGAINFFHSPRGENGDAFVRKNGDACRFDYGTKEFVAVSKDGIIKSYNNYMTDSDWREEKENGQ